MGYTMTTKVAKLIRLLASDKPGEVVAAAGALGRALKANGWDFHTLAEAIEGSPLVPQHDDDTRSWRAVRLFCASHPECLTTREAEFISSLKSWRGHPTEKQMNWLLLIERKVRDRQAR